ncbi:histidine kinase [Scytonema hofmannii FACHB-248]|uniref:Histidine kinase n=1 Tax=Scytonema hofmannii FACHB-248 TaxID=1842502 RepID=A0ABR8GM61_9CYAN|nr:MULTISPECIES: histidine kinase [Nostocales]MBD2604253.1 histidine kinase [Scytonema hofmannii FACHB-248]
METRGQGDKGIILFSQCPIPNSQCPIPNAQCPMPNY